MKFDLLKDCPLEIQKVAYGHHVKEEGRKAHSFESALKRPIVSLFIFGETTEGYDFWDEVVIGNNIDHFYTLYPKQKDILEDFAKFNPNV